MSTLSPKSANKSTHRLTGVDFGEMFIAAYELINAHINLVNGLNVFPVPDGDTGTNMALTMKAVAIAIKDSLDSGSRELHDISTVMARASLMEARGNSGVILSQFFKGISEGVGGKDFLGVVDWTTCMNKAKLSSYSAVGNPVEGTMLTVISEVSNQAQKSYESDENLEQLFDATCEQIKNTVKKTPSMLPVLAEAGVVDAGAYGLDIIFEGMRLNMKGVSVKGVDVAVPGMKNYKSFSLPNKLFLERSVNKDYGFCAQVLISDNMTDIEEIKKAVGKMGDSVVVINEATMLKVHVHVASVEKLLEYAGTLGTIEQHSADDMDTQTGEFAASHNERMEPEETSLIVVVDGIGISQIFVNLGACQTIYGGPNNSPSVQEILAKIELAPSDNIIFLPNDKNILLTAEQAAKLTKKTVEIVPTETLQQGINCALDFNNQQELQRNAKLMINSIGTVKGAEIFLAHRSTTLDGVDVAEGDFIGNIDGRLVISAPTIEEVLCELIGMEDNQNAELVTLYRGADLTEGGSTSHYKTIKSKFPHFEFELINGGQSHCIYMISFE